MNFEDAISLLKGRLHNYQSTVIDDTLKAEMNAKQYEMEQEDFMPWFLLTESATAQSLLEDERLPVPQDFIQEWEEGCLAYKLPTEAKYSHLDKDDYDYLRHLYECADGRPRGYALAGEYFLLVPRPIIAYDWRMRYYAHQPLNVNPDDENMWLKHAANWLVAETGLVVANNYLNNATAAQGFDAWRQEAKSRIEKFNVAREEANRERMMGE